MKKLVISVGIAFVLVICSLIMTPIIFNKKIVKSVERYIFEQTNTNLHMSNVSFNMLKDFPNVSVKIKDSYVSDVNGDTIINLKHGELSLDLFKLLISKKVLINTLNINAADINYTNKEDGKTVEIRNLDLLLIGDLYAVDDIVDIELFVDELTYSQNKTRWLNNVKIKLDSKVQADFINKRFELLDNQFAINNLDLNLSGIVMQVIDKYKIDLNISSTDSQFKDFFELIQVPLIDTNELETKGNFNLQTKIYGEYYKDCLPSIQLDIDVVDARMKYKDLAESIDNINFNISFDKTEGTKIDSARISLENAKFTVGADDFAINLELSNLNNPYIKGCAYGNLDLNHLKKSLPMEGISMKGKLTTDILFDGLYSYIQKEEYENFTAKGNIIAKEIEFVNNNFPHGLYIPLAQVTLTPSYLELHEFGVKIYSSDFIINGKLSNYIPYLFSNNTLKGDFKLNSKRVNLNEFLLAKKQARNTNANKNNDANILKVPDNIDIKLQTDISQVIYDNFDIRNVEGKVDVYNTKATLRKLQMQLLDGNIVLSGVYSTPPSKAPNYNFDISASKLNIQKMYKSFSIINKNVPLIQNAKGTVSADLAISADLDMHMTTINNTLNGKANLRSSDIIIKNNDFFRQMSGIISNTNLNDITVKQVNLNIDIINGNLTFKPMSTAIIAGNRIRIQGHQSIDGNLDYLMSITIPRSLFGSEITRVIKSVPGSQNLNSLELDVTIGGTIMKPRVTPDISKAVRAVTMEAAKEFKNNSFNKLKDLFK